MLEKEIKFFNAHNSEWQKSERGKFALIKGDELVGFYNTYEDALAEGARRFKLESFLVRLVAAEKEKELNIPALTLGLLRADITPSIRQAGENARGSNCSASP